MGQLLRIALILLAVWLAYCWLRRMFKGRTRGDPQNTARTPIQMLPCTHCGAYVPETHVLRHGENTYCCRDHLPRDAR